MPTLEELREQKMAIEKQIEETERKELGPDWMEYLRDRLPEFERSGGNAFRCLGTEINAYAAPHYVTITGSWGNETLHLLKTIVEMLEAAKRGELEGWPND